MTALYVCAYCGNQAVQNPNVAWVQTGLLALPFLVLPALAVVFRWECRRIGPGKMGNTAP